METKQKSALYWINIIIGLLFVFAFRYLPAPEGMTQVAVHMIGITIGTLYLWITISTGWPTFVCLFALGTTGVMTYVDVAKNSIGSFLFLFLICCFLVCHALVRSGIMKRIALWFISRPIGKKSPWILISLFYGGILFISLFIPFLPLFTIGIPLAEEMLKELGYKKEDKDLLPQVLILGLAFVVSLGLAMTPIANSTVLLGLNILKGATGIDTSYLSYIAFGVPVSIVAGIIMLLFFKYVVKPDTSRFKSLDVSKVVGEKKPLSKTEIVTSITYLLVFVGWIIPGLFPTAAISSFIGGMGTVGPILAATIVLCIIRIDGKPVLNLAEALKESVPWEGMFLVGGVIALSTGLSNSDVGLIAYLTTAVAPLVSGLPPALFVFVLIVATVLLTNFISNNIAVAVLSSLAVAFAAALGFNAAVLAVLVTCAANHAFATPSSTLGMTITMGTGWVDMSKMIKWGFVMVAISIITLMCVGYPLASVLFK